MSWRTTCCGADARKAPTGPRLLVVLGSPQAVRPRSALVRNIVGVEACARRDRMGSKPPAQKVRRSRFRLNAVSHAG